MQSPREQQGETEGLFNEQCNETGENDRKGETRNLKKIGNIKGTFHPKMGTIKDRNGADTTEAEEIKKRRQEYTEELYKKDLDDPNNHDGAVSVHSQSQTFWSVKSSGPQEALRPIKLVEVTESQKAI